MALLADEGHLEFNRRRAFDAFARRHPQRAGDVELIARLEPFLALTRRHGVLLPFPPAGPCAERSLQDTVAAIRRVAETRS